MRNTKRFAAILAATVMTAAGLSALAACTDKGGSQGGDSTDVTGTYTVTFSSSEISGNVRHTGYLTAMQSTETNTLVLKADNTYEYTKYVTSHRETTAATTTSYFVRSTAAALSDETDSNVLFAWASAGDGNCTFVCYKNGTYDFEYTTMGAKESGTWSWNNWTFTVTTAGGNSVTAAMDSETHALNFTYVADMGGGMLTHPFTCESSVWGGAFGGVGSYTPVESGEEDSQITVSAYYAGTGQKSTEYNGQTVTYDVTGEMIMLSSGDVYYVESTETNSNHVLGEWSKDEGGVSITIDGKSATMTSQTTISYDGLTLSYGTLPEKYNDTDWAEIIKESQTPVTYGPIVISYLFKGTYTSDGNTVTLNPATSCTWSEDWGPMVAQGFTNVSGDENDRVYPKGETGEWYLPLDHFSSKYYFAVNSATTVTNNYAIKVTVNSNGSFEYVEESVFD